MRFKFRDFCKQFFLIIILVLTAPYHKEKAYLLTIENQDDSELSEDMEVYPW
jgi:hypothetical protein